LGDFLARYTSIRISVKDKEKLERIAQMIQAESLAQTLR